MILSPLLEGALNMRKSLWIVAGLLLSTAACAPRVLRTQPVLVEDTLYFGTNQPQGTVTPSQWDAFLRREVTPRFPDGLTVWDAQGQWKNAKGLVGKEATKVLLLIHSDTPAGDEAVQAVIEIYKKEFGQESVLRVRDRPEVSF